MDVKGLLLMLSTTMSGCAKTRKALFSACNDELMSKCAYGKFVSQGQPCMHRNRGDREMDDCPKPGETGQINEVRYRNGNKQIIRGLFGCEDASRFGAQRFYESLGYKLGAHVGYKKRLDSGQQLR